MRNKGFRITHILALCLALCLSPAAQAAQEPTTVRVAIAANLSALVPSLKEAFESQTGHELEVSLGSSGKLLAQIVHGGPYDVFVSADRSRPRKAQEAGAAVPDTNFTYARGRLALIGTALPAESAPEEALKTVLSKASRFAMANPRTAPYGLATQETLQSLALWDQHSAKSVLGESVVQAWQFVRSGNIPAGFVAKSQLAEGEEHIPVPASLHNPIDQDAVLLKRGKDNPAARDFMGFLKSATARAILQESGYDLPPL
ncbi:molybdate ABC transporter substrate-binding protein [Kiloniella sp. b19]|uniref:molybdate ABC transporter substrate-binding protein n=1 Tax=Kiloniella sp. GXU_MW_B19 TaxID=3141326 RepID=UPI0031E381EB